MEYTEDDYLMISGIQHFKFCRRQWALIHVEQQWAENVHTAVGKLMHQKVHDPYLTEKRKDTILVRALPVSSRIMGVSGECDLVEFHKCEDGIRLHGHSLVDDVVPHEGTWIEISTQRDSWRLKGSFPTWERELK